MIHISLPAETLFHLFGIPITNATLTAWIVMVFLIVTSLLIRFRLSMIPGMFQVVVEEFIGGLYKLFESVNGEKTNRFFSLLATFFIFIIFSNWVELLPGVGTIGLFRVENAHEMFIPFFRPATTDLNTTVALAIIAVFTLQYYGMVTLGVTDYLSRFFSLKDPIQFFVGILEIVSEFAKVISFAFRLFGNIFAGEVLLTVVAFLMPLLAPLPFLALELFVGFIQALVFSMLTAAFLNIATQKVGH